MKRPLSLLICLLVPTVVLLVGLIWAAAYAHYEFPKLNVESGRGVVPPGFDITLKDPHQYSIRLHRTGTFEGRTFEGSGEVPEGGKVLIFEKSSGNRIELNDFALGPVNVPGESAVVIGSFEIFREMELELSGRGFGDGALISVAKTNDAKRLRTLTSFISIVILTLFVSVMTLIILLHRRAQLVATEPK